MPINHRFRYAGAMLFVCLTFAMHLSFAGTARAQLAGSTTGTDLVVDGRVQKVFQSGNEILVQVLVQRSEALQPVASGRVRYPAPGEFLYVHRDDSGGSNQQLPIPRPGTVLRAFLNAGTSGQWEADNAQWYKENPSGDESGLARRSANDGDQGLGVTTEKVALGRTSALKVIRVRPDSAAARAGVEPGDILVEANRRPVGSQRELDDAYRSSRDQFSLTVRDVRSRRDVLVKVPPNSAQPGTEMRDDRRSLGVKGKLAFYKGEPAVEVTEVAPGSPADRAGIVAGDLVLEAEGKSVDSLQSLDTMMKNSRGKLTLKLANPNSRQERSIQVGP